MEQRSSQNQGQNMTNEDKITELLAAWSEGDTQARDELFQRVEKDLRQIAAFQLQRQRKNHTLQVTALVHEVWLKLFSGKVFQPENYYHLKTLVSMATRQILLNYARKKKEEGKRIRVALEENHAIQQNPFDFLALDEAIQALGEENQELYELLWDTYWGGLKAREVAEKKGVSLATVERRLKMARGWIRQRLLQSPEN